jgi:hypothetical protein
LIGESEGLIRLPDDGDTHCRFCGAELFWAIPGKTTREEIVAYAQRVGRDDIRRDTWIHPGVYCLNGCVFALHEYHSLTDAKIGQAQNPPTADDH